MYDNAPSGVSAAGTSAGALAVTGVDFLWYIVAGIALIGAGFALMRLVPRKEE